MFCMIRRSKMCAGVVLWMTMTAVGAAQAPSNQTSAVQATAAQPAQTRASAAKTISKKTTAPESKDQPSIDPKEIRLLEESHAAAAALDATERAILLEKLCNSAEDMKDLAKSWCTELFQVAKDELPAGDVRAQAQSVAARAMSVHYPETALAMLQDVDVTDAQSDQRASVSRMIFEAMLQAKGAKGFPELMAAAARLGETGSYPYMATTVMLYGGGVPHDPEEAARRHYSDSQVDVCNEVLQQGLNYYNKESMNVKADFQFMTLLRAASFSKCASGWLLHQASTDFAGEVVKVSSAAINGDEKVKPHAAKMLFESAQHLLQQIDPVLAESVEKKVGDVRSIAEAPSSGPRVKPGQSSPWMNDPDARALFDKIGAAEGVLNNAPDGTTPHTPEMDSAIREGFAAALKLVSKVEEIDPEAAVALRRGGGNLPAFMDAAMRIWPAATIAQIEAMPDGELKAHLLVTAAQGVARDTEKRFVLHRQLR